MERHFKHKNPLIIHNELPNLDGREVRCLACLHPLLSGPFYSCGDRYCYLHKVYAEVPLQLKHTLHSDHPLTLGPRNRCKCMACGTVSWRDSTYECRPCGLTLGLECASMALRIQHECHPHPLIPLLEPAIFHCYACGNKHTGLFYKCSICYFLVHESCASMPSTLKHSHHNHPLTLTCAHEESPFPRFYDICHEKVIQYWLDEKVTQYWFYQCIGCRYYAHFSCATSKKEISADEEEDVLDPNVIHLPVPNEFINLINDFVKSTKQEDIKIATNLDHFGHPHTLAFFDEQINNVNLHYTAVPQQHCAIAACSQQHEAAAQAYQQQAVTGAGSRCNSGLQTSGFNH